MEGGDNAKQVFFTTEEQGLVVNGCIGGNDVLQVFGSISESGISEFLRIVIQ